METFQDEPRPTWHPQNVPVKMSPHTLAFFLSPADCVVLTAGAKASCRDVGASSSTPSMLGCGYPHLGAWQSCSTQDFTPGSDTWPGKRNQAEKREEHPVAPCALAGGNSRFWGHALCRSCGIM